jgi:hypothetical protein
LEVISSLEDESNLKFQPEVDNTDQMPSNVMKILNENCVQQQLILKHLQARQIYLDEDTRKSQLDMLLRDSGASFMYRHSPFGIIPTH